MRKIRFVFVVCLLYAQSCFAQWQSLTTNIGANDCQFITPCKGIAVEGNGRVYQTFDGGANWSEFNVSTLPFQQRPWLHSIDFVNDSTLFAVGGGCFKSTDFGVTWTEVNTNMTTSALFSIQFLNSQIGYIGGGNGNIIKTTNGGNTWIQDTLDNLNRILNTVDCISSDYVYVMGGSAVYNSDFSCFIITATADGPGTIEPEGIQTVAENSSLTFNIYPYAQAQVAGLVID